ncbi:MAG: hypothetical protein HY785_20260 [Oscillatoriophycideae cyanobacterium NC_groundwater_1537_Pr4_S-0.65um_50_18]|nr:hypothetical protein [Oscillatoriophycideae cyanobacterium NC_groundwater_1537_Pr4_S-0.65um_50_18]
MTVSRGNPHNRHVSEAIGELRVNKDKFVTLDSLCRRSLSKVSLGSNDR